MTSEDTLSSNLPRTKPSERAVAMHDAVLPLVRHLIAQRETAGVCVLGSFALSGIRPHADIYSDFDLALFVSLQLPSGILELAPLAFQRAVQPYLPGWLPNFKFVYPGGDPLGESSAPPLQINIHQLVLEYEECQNRVWPPDRREAFAHTCDVVYDPSGRVASLRSTKSVPPPAELARRINDNIALIPVTIEHSIEKCAVRGLAADATLAIGEVCDYLLDLVYALNGRDLPHRKWRVGMLCVLPDLPSEFERRLHCVLLASASTEQQLLEKIDLLKQLFDDTLDFVQRRHQFEDPYRKLVTETRPGFQLKDYSFADEMASHGDDQYAKMQNQKWNSINFGLPIDE